MMSMSNQGMQASPQSTNPMMVGMPGSMGMAQQRMKQQAMGQNNQVCYTISQQAVWIRVRCGYGLNVQVSSNQYYVNWNYYMVLRQNNHDINSHKKSVILMLLLYQSYKLVKVFLLLENSFD